MKLNIFICSCLVIPSASLRIRLAAHTLDSHSPKISNAYVTFVSQPTYFEHAVRLTATLNETGSLKKYPHIYMVRKGSSDEHKARMLAAEAKKIGWNLKVETYKPLEIKFHTQFEFWDEAWQRVTLFSMGDRFDRLLHVDADAYVWKNIEDVLETGHIPSAARRMLGCMSKQEMCNHAPVSNFMLMKPNATIMDGLLEVIHNLNSVTNLELKHSIDECIQFDFYKEPVNLFSPQDISYFDCFSNHNDTTLRQMGMDTNKIPKIVHLGIPGKQMIQQHRGANAQEKEQIRDRIQKSGSVMRLNVWDKTESLNTSPEVQQMLKVISSKAKEFALTRSVTESAMFNDMCE